MNTKIAASYPRTSREKDDAFSIPSQVAGNRDYAREHGFQLPEEYEFREEFTGKAIERPQMNKIRQLIRQRKIQALIVFVADRFARKIGVGEFLLDELFEYGVELHIVSWSGSVRDTPEDRARFNFEMLFSDFERRKIRERTDRGRTQKLTGSDGIPAAWLGQGPIDKYGFKKVGKKRNTRMVIVEDEAKVVRLIFYLYVHERKGARLIARYLNATNVPTRSQAKGFERMLSTQWTRNEVYKILRDDRYTGVWWANQQTIIKGKHRSRPKEEWIRLDFPELRIIDDETFNQAQTLLTEGRAKYAPAPINEYLMARRIRCSCGYATSVRTENRKPSKWTYYYCSTRVKENVPKCPMPTVRGDVLEGKLWARLEAFLHNPEEQLQTLQHAQADMAELYQEAIERMRECEATRTDYRRRLAVYSDQEAEGLISREMFRGKKAELDKKLAAAEEVYQEYQQLLANKILTNEDISSMRRDLVLLQSELQQLGELDFQKRRRLIEAMNITGTMHIENGWQVLYVYVYTCQLDILKLQEIEPPSNANNDIPHQNAGGSDLWEENPTLSHTGPLGAARHWPAGR